MATIVTASAGYKYVNSSGADILAGTPVINGGLFGIAAATIAAGAQGWIETTGVWDFDCANTETASIGDVAYWDATNSKITATASTNQVVGYFVEAVASGATTCRVLLDGAASAAATSGSGSGSGG